MAGAGRILDVARAPGAGPAVWSDQISQPMLCNEPIGAVDVCFAAQRAIGSDGRFGERRTRSGTPRREPVQRPSRHLRRPVTDRYRRTRAAGAWRGCRFAPGCARLRRVLVHDVRDHEAFACALRVVRDLLDLRLERQWGSCLRAGDTPEALSSWDQDGGRTGSTPLM